MFRLCVFAIDAEHVIAAGGWGVYICYESKGRNDTPLTLSRGELDSDIFRLGVFAYNARHVIAECGCGVYICHETKIEKTHP